MLVVECTNNYFTSFKNQSQQLFDMSFIAVSFFRIQLCIEIAEMDWYLGFDAIWWLKHNSGWNLTLKSLR